MQHTKFRREDVETLERYKPSRVSQVAYDIADLIISDRRNYEVENQCDDAENYMRHGDEYYERVYVILACCILLDNDDWLHMAVKKFFVEQAGTQNEEHGADLSDEENEPYIQRMMECVKKNQEVKKITDLIFTWYMTTHDSGSSEELTDYDRSVRINRMKLTRGLKIANELCPPNGSRIDVLECAKRSKGKMTERKIFSSEEMGIGSGLAPLSEEDLKKMESSDGFDWRDFILRD